MKKNNAPRKSVRIPIIGTVGDVGIKLKPQFEKEEREAEVERARREARAVAVFLNSGPPDFLMEATLNTIGNAFDHFGLPKPQDDGGLADYDEQNLQTLFLKTERLRWDDLWTDRERVLDALHELLHNPMTPGDLFEAVATFVCDQSNECGQNLFHSEVILGEVLKSVAEDELRGSIIAAREVSDATN